MQVRIIGATQPLIDGMSKSEELLAYCARVSNATNQGNHATGWKLLKRLIAHKEWSPFEMVSVTTEIVTTRDIARQILRHRSFSFQEFSQRYAEVPDMPVLREARDAHPTDRQSSVPCRNPLAELDWYNAQERVWKTATQAYQAALNRGMSKEVARVLLPEGITPSRLYMAGTLRSWIHYCELRMTPGTQKEHRDIANACWQEICVLFPTLAGGE